MTYQPLQSEDATLKVGQVGALPEARQDSHKLAILATFLHELRMGAYPDNEIDGRAKLALDRVGLADLNAVVALATPAPAAPDARAISLSAEDRAILEAVFREMDEDDGGNAPGHGHEVPGIWDSDNGAKAGKPCAWCLTWAKFTSLIDGAAPSASAPPGDRSGGNT
jgi:hypothetical protein